MIARSAAAPAAALPIVALDRDEGEAHGRNATGGDSTAWDRPLRPLVCVDCAVEKIVKVHAADVEQRHRRENDSDPPVPPIGPREYHGGEHIGPHSRQIGKGPSRSRINGIGASAEVDTPPSRQTAQCFFAQARTFPSDIRVVVV